MGIGLYSEGVGIITALSQGLEGKFRERLLAASENRVTRPSYRPPPMTDPNCGAAGSHASNTGPV